MNVSLDDFGYRTVVFDVDGERVGSLPGILSVTLYKGMRFTIHGWTDEFVVERWEMHLGHEDELAGLRIVVRKTGNSAVHYPPHSPRSTDPKAGK